MKDGIFSKAKALAGGALKRSGDTLDGTAKFMEERRGAITAVTRDALDHAGRATEEAGRTLLEEAAFRSHGDTARLVPQTLGEKVASRAASYAIEATALVGRSMDRVGRATRKASPTIGAAAGSMIAGTASTVSGAVDSFALTQQDFADLERRLAAAGAESRRQAQAELERINFARLFNRRTALLDVLVIGGVTLADILEDPRGVAPEVEQAFALAYPGLSGAGETFADVVARLSPEGLVGLVNGVKGKLFELELVDQLNNGGLVEGLRAEMAASATQAGHDIVVRDAQGNIVEELQAKATESVAYVKDALERYPNIDITTTSEVHGHLMALGLSPEAVTDSEIAEATLQQKVEAAAGIRGQFDAEDFVPSALGLAVIAFSAFTKPDANWEERGALFGERAAIVTVAGVAAKSVLIATNTWWIAVPAGIGLRVMVDRGDAKRRRYDALKGIVERLERSNSARAATE